MRTFARILFCSVCLLSLTAAPVVLANDEDEASSTRQTAKEKRDARRNKGKGGEDAPVAQGSLAKEIAALNRAAGELAKVNDEAKAKEVAKSLCNEFAYMNPVLGGSDGELQVLSKAQNGVSKEMWRLMAEPWFESSRLQEAWTLMTDQFSRRSAQNRRRK